MAEVQNDSISIVGESRTKLDFRWNLQNLIYKIGNLIAELKVVEAQFTILYFQFMLEPYWDNEYHADLKRWQEKWGDKVDVITENMKNTYPMTADKKTQFIGAKMSTIMQSYIEKMGILSRLMQRWGLLLEEGTTEEIGGAS